MLTEPFLTFHQKILQIYAPIIHFINETEKEIFTHTHTHTHTYIYIYIYTYGKEYGDRRRREGLGKGDDGRRKRGQDDRRFEGRA